MAINFTLGQLLGPTDLNSAFAQKLDLATTGPQQMRGPLSLANLNVTIGVQTQDLTVTGNTLFASASAIQLPVGNTLQRPFNGQPGWLRVNTDSGLLEALLPSGNWVNLQTVTAAQSPATAPTSIASVQFGQASSSSIPVAWAIPVGGTAPFQYQIQYRLSGTSNWIIWAANIVAQSTTISGLLPAARYEFQVIVHNIAGSATSPVSATNTLGFLAGGPTNLSAFSPTSTSLSLSWTPVSSSVPIAYVVQYAANGVGVWAAIAPTSSTTATITGLSANSTYVVQVIAKTSGGSFDSLVVQGTTTASATVSPNTVAALTYTNIGVSTLSVAWQPPTAGTSPFLYQLQYQFGGTTTWINYGSATTATSLNLVNLNSGGIYSFRVTATNSLGASTSQPFPVTMMTVANTLGQMSEYQSSGASFPIIGGPQIGLVSAASAIDVLGLTISDPTAGYLPGSVLVAVRSGAGSITMTDSNGNQINGSGTTNIPSFATTLAGALRALSSLTYTAATIFGSVPVTDSITVTVTDQSAQTSQLSIAMTVVPLASGSPSPTPSPTPSPPTPVPPGTPPGRTATGQPTDMSGVQAVRASSFTNNIGVGTNFTGGYYGPDFSPTTAAVIENSINYLGGIRFVRDSGFFDYFREGSFLQQIGQNCNVKFFLEISGSGNSTTNNFNAWFNTLSQIQVFAQNYPGYLLGVQGVNTAAFTSNAQIIDLFSYNQAIAFQGNVLSGGTSAGVQVVELELNALPLRNVSAANLGLLTLFPDSIPSGGAFTTTAGGSLADVAIDAAIVTPGFPVFAEFGYQSFPDNANAHETGNNFVNETTQAKYMLECLMDMYISPTLIQYVMWYQLYDTPLSTFGLFNGYGGTPKVAAQALSGLLTVLQDFTVTQDTFTQGLLNYTVTGKPSQYGSFTSTGYKELLLQVSTGRFVLMMCNEQPLNTVGTDSEISVAPAPVTLRFNERPMTQVTVLDSIAFGKFGFTPAGIIAQANNVSSISFPLPPYPVYILITHP